MLLISLMTLKYLNDANTPQDYTALLKLVALIMKMILIT
jgi:hypothetical protein